MGEVRREGSHSREGEPVKAEPAVEAGRGPSISGRLRVLQGEVAEAGSRLRTALGETDTSLVADGLHLLGEQACRVAVIGQIKAGKSSFINALVGARELLPTDVNPWTTAITSLSFGRPGAEPKAVFQFFSAGEWERLAEGEGRLGELTERFVPGFERQLLRRHMQAVKQRAERRLGARFHELLGQRHELDHIDAVTLSRYVCSGDHAGSPSHGQTAGQFADITRSAELTCPGGPFEYPTTIIDTPGTNDPLLVRDEITRRSLDAADIYLVVLTARQPLAPSDLSLLRILRGLHKEQIVVFINRVDELEGIRTERETIVDFVRKRLAREFPGSDIPVVAGSAWWGRMALSGEVDTNERGLDGRTLSYLQEQGRVRREDLLRLAHKDPERSRILRAALLAESGIPAVREAIDRMLPGCRCTHVVNQLALSFAEIARAARDRARMDLGTLSREFDATLATAERSGSELERLRAEMGRLEEVVAVVERSANDFRKQLMGIVQAETTRLRGRLIAAVDGYSAREAEVLLDTLRQGPGPRRWACDTDRLRRALAQDFVAGYRHTEHRISALHDKVTPQLKQLLALLIPDAREATAPPPVHRATVAAPPMTALGNRVVLDLHLPWWRAWWTARPSPEERGRELVDLVREDFYPLVDDLMASCTGELEARVTSAAKWSFGVSSAIVGSLRAQHAKLLAHYEGIRAGIDGEADTESIARKRAYIQDLQGRESVGDEVFTRLDALLRSLAELIAGQQLTEGP